MTGSRINRGELKTVRFSFAYDTPALAEGIPVYRATSGDLIIGSWLSVPEVFDGDTDTFAEVTKGGISIGCGGNLSRADTYAEVEEYGFTLVPDNSNFVRFLTGGLLTLRVLIYSDGAERAPVNTQGKAELGLLVLSDA